jgi:hypothetical protein
VAEAESHLPGRQTLLVLVPAQGRDVRRPHRWVRGRDQRRRGSMSARPSRCWRRGRRSSAGRSGTRRGDIHPGHRNAFRGEHSAPAVPFCSVRKPKEARNGGKQSARAADQSATEESAIGQEKARIRKVLCIMGTADCAILVAVTQLPGHLARSEVTPWRGRRSICKRVCPVRMRQRKRQAPELVSAYSNDSRAYRRPTSAA